MPVAVESLVLGALAAIGCAPRPLSPALPRRPSSSATVPPQAPRAAAVVDAGEPANKKKPLTERLRERLCADQAGCTVSSVKELSHKKGGPSRLLVRTVLAASAQPPGPGGDPNCDMQQFWIVALDKDDRIIDRPSLGDGCVDDAPPDAWCGLPPRIDVKHEKNRLVATSTSLEARCMGSFESTGQLTVSVDTLRVTRISWTLSRTIAPRDDFTSVWDLERRRGTNEWFCPPLHVGPRRTIPRVTFKPSPPAGAWRHSSVQPCASEFSGAGGSALRGTRKAGTKLGVLVADDGSLFVDVVPEPHASKQARLQVCFADTEIDVFGQCVLPRGKPTCLTVRLDGTPIGPNTNIDVERAPGAPRFRFALGIDDEASLSVAYIDPKRHTSIATNAFNPRDSGTLNEQYELGHIEVCRQVGKRFALVPGKRPKDRLFVE